MKTESDDEGTDVGNIYGMMVKSDHELHEQLAHSNDDITESDENENNINSKDRALVSRVFGKMEAGSLRGSIFAMSSLALGTGCLTLPQLNEKMSMVVVIIMTIIGAMASYWSLSILIIAGKKRNIYNYSRLVKDLFGPGLGRTSDIIIMLFIIGTMIAYQVISKNLLIFSFPAHWKICAWHIFINNLPRF